MDVRENAKILIKRKKEFIEEETKLLNESANLFLQMEKLIDSNTLNESQIREKWEECYYKEDALIAKRNKVKEEIRKIDEELLTLRGLIYLKSKLKGKKVDLYKRGIDPYYYDICLHDTKESIGYINYRENVDKISKGSIGNIGYHIVDDYRGNGFALEALQLLSDKLYQDGISVIYIAVKPQNKSSIRVAEKFGGELIEDLSGDFSQIYKCDLNLLRNKKTR